VEGRGGKRRGVDVELKMDPNDGHIMGSEADKVEN
jgi:hypothetical protein